MASRRAELIGRLAGSQLAIEGTIAAMASAGRGVPPELRAHLTELIAMRSEIASASPGDLATLARSVTALVAAASAGAQQAQASASEEATEALHIAAEGAQRAAASAMEYARTVSLRFASEEDERSYREREAERQAYMRAQQANGTPEGQLSANGAAIGQLADAHAHGASGPEFDKQWNDLVSSTEKLRDRLRAQGKSTAEFDQHLRDDLRRIMKSKGYSDAQIDAQLASNPDPIQAAKAFVKDGNDVATLKNSVTTGHAEIEARAGDTISEQAKADAKDVFAAFKASGVIASDVQRDGAPIHGVASVAKETVSRTV